MSFNAKDKENYKKSLAGLTDQRKMLDASVDPIMKEKLKGTLDQDELLKPKNFDQTHSIVRSQDHTKEQPAALTEKEYVVSIPALIALGKGSLDKGLEWMERFHNALRNESKRYLTPQQIADAGLMRNKEPEMEEPKSSGLDDLV